MEKKLINRSKENEFEDKTLWIDISGRDAPKEKKGDAFQPIVDIPTLSPQKLDFVQLSINFAKWLLLFLTIFLLGRLRFSIIWMFIAAGAVTILWNLKRNKKQARLALDGINDTTSEKKEVLAKLHELPSWVYFPDVDRAEWLNKIIKQLWPFINDYVKVLIKNQIEPQVKAKLPAIIKSFHFETIDVGDMPPRIGGIKVYQERVNRDEIIIDMEIYYSGDAEIVLSVNNLKSGVKNINFHGYIRAHIYPLISDIPFVGALKVFLLNRPAIDFDLTQLANALDFPGLSQLLRRIMNDVIASMIVLPNKFGLILSKDVEAHQIKYYIPKGVIRITIYSAHNLVNADVSLLGRGKSDPYAKIFVGAKEFKTAIINNNLNPIWNECFEAIVDEPFGQKLEVNIFDQDPNKDDFLGRVDLDIESIVKEGYIDSNFNLEDTKHGDIHLRADWLRPIEPFVITTGGKSDKRNSSPTTKSSKSKDEAKDLISSDDATTENTTAARENVDQTIQSNRALALTLLQQELAINSDEFIRRNIRGSLSTAILVVYVDSAKNLPFPANLATEPSPYVIFNVSGGEGSINSNVSNNQDIQTSNKNRNTEKDIVAGEANKYKTQTKAKTTNPVWEQCFTMLVTNPTLTTLNLEVKDEKSGKHLGRMTFPIVKLLDEPHFDKTGNFQLTTQGYSDATLSLILSLRMLKSGPDPSFNRPDSVKAGANINRTDKGAADVGVMSQENKKRPGEGPVEIAGRTPPPPYSAGFVREGVDAVALPAGSLERNIPPPQFLYKENEGYALDSEGRPLAYNEKDDSYREGEFMDGGFRMLPPGYTGSLPRKSLPLIHNNTYEDNPDFLRQRRNTIYPRVLLNFYYDDAQRKLIILLERVENINATGDITNADPYVKFEILPTLKESTKRKSIIIKNSLNPVFNEKFEWNVGPEELDNRKLIVTVKTDGSLLKPGVTVGTVEINLGEVNYNESRGLWFPLDNQQ